MNILVCVKRVPAPGARINITEDGLGVDTAFLGFTVSPHEECAVEQAVQLVEKHGGEVTVLTLGPAEAEEQLRTAVSVGAAKAVLVPISESDWDPQRTAQAIASVITDLENANGKFDLVLSEMNPQIRAATKLAFVWRSSWADQWSMAQRDSTSKAPLPKFAAKAKRAKRSTCCQCLLRLA